MAWVECGVLHPWASRPTPTNSNSKGYTASAAVWPFCVPTLNDRRQIRMEGHYGKGLRGIVVA